MSECVCVCVCVCVCSTLTKRFQFSELVNKAFAEGLTEPDPRDDLNGMDVAR